jgi:hypothetical protein
MNLLGKVTSCPNHNNARSHELKMAVSQDVQMESFGHHLEESSGKLPRLHWTVAKGKRMLAKKH